MVRAWSIAVSCVVVLLPVVARAQDVQAGKDVYGPCAACHGANGEGGKGGEYPRVAGQPVSFTLASLKRIGISKRETRTGPG